MAAALDSTTLFLRLPARPAQAPILRAELRIWMMQHRAGDDADVEDVLAAATGAFHLATAPTNGPRTIAIEVEASYAAGVVDVGIRGYGPEPVTTAVRRLVSPVPRRPAAAVTAR